MDLVKCPICGEEYSKSYKACPFCAESGPFDGTVKRRRVAGRRVEKRRGPKILGPAMIIVLLLLAAVLVYAFFGDEIKAKLRPEPEKPPVDDVQITLMPASMELAKDESQPLTVSGADEYAWSSSDEAVATVDQNGKVTAVGAGTATITVTDKEGKLSAARCEVTVSDPGAEPVEPGPDNPGTDDPGPDNPGTDPEKKPILCAEWSGKELPKTTINGETVYDMTLRSGDATRLFISGSDSDVYWSSDSAAVTVDQNGLVKRVGSGTAYVTATVDGQTVKCRVL
ncbi:MAG: Ig-like domain-containing protein [Oscillospiraceae bacterium]|nr:Ig-like domain-containing protein [Oscillospiraceae bacterium]